MLAPTVATTSRHRRGIDTLRRSCGFVLLTLLLACWLVIPECYAQAFGTCKRGEAKSFLDVNNVRTALFTEGHLFSSSGGDGSIYRVPKGGNADALWMAAIWIGGFVDGERRFAGVTYYPWEFWPGPLDEMGNPPVNCSQYDRIYSIYRDSLQYYEETGISTRDLTDWPAKLGAPVIDGDGNPNNYNLEGGDRPALVGDQMIWWVMNDAGNEKTWSKTSPIPLEIRVTGFAYRSFDSYPFINDVLRHTTFFRFQLNYKGVIPFEDAWFGLFVEPDIGYSQDDFIGSDSTLGLAFAYNGDDFDEDETHGGYIQLGTGYGDLPPAIGLDFFKGPVILPDGLDNDSDGQIDESDERAGMTRFLKWNSDGSVQGNPSGSTAEPYNYLRGIWRNGNSMTLGGTGYGGSIPVNFMYPGNPPEYWSEEKTCDIEFLCRNTPSDRDMLMSTGPFRMEPGDEQEIVVGIIWSRGEDRLDSVYKLKREDAVIQSAIDILLEPRLPVVEKIEEIPKRYTLAHNYPNPFAGTTTFSYDLPADDTVILRVYDVLGRVVDTLVDVPQPAGRYQFEFDGSDLPAGVYFYRFTTNRVDGVHKMVLMR